eukprot:TRINITY_DN275_c0_g1_i1.p1 TRINITY_DN275_c0_g1~~TRINITY_DN275_c0_g1_i1.p1  ORF type:complete len:211 (+),score=46.53 TRINITY_DN275_c0_g1_i1:55-687(+)
MGACASAVQENRNALEKAAGSASSAMAHKIKKGEVFTLPSGGDFVKCQVGLGWQSGGIDLDASVAVFNRNKEFVDSVSYKKGESKDGAVVHGGDRRSGGSGDQECLMFDFSKMAEDVWTLWIVICIYSGSANFSTIQDTYFRVCDPTGTIETCRFTVDGSLGSSNAVVIGRLKRTKEGKWKVKAYGDGVTGNCIEDTIPEITEKYVKKGK